MITGQLTSGSAPLILACALLPFAASCGETTAVDLTFEPDQNLTNVKSLIASLRSLKLVLDAPDGLYPDQRTDQVSSVHLEDLDADGKSELWFVVEIPEDRLPLVRLERGGLPRETFKIQVEGYKEEQPLKNDIPIAEGGRDWIQFQTGLIKNESVPFNIRPIFRAPKVNDVRPENGAQEVSPNISSVLVNFSKVMYHSSLGKEGVFVVNRVDSSGETLVPANRIEVGKITNVLSGEEISFAKYYLTPPLKDGIYNVRVSPEAVDESGNALDNVPIQPDNQEFFSQFRVGTLDKEGAMTASCIPPCLDPPTDDCAPGTMLNPQTGQCEKGQCPQSCPTLTVCDPLIFTCVEDCRIHGSYGGCSHPEARCDPDTGLCEK